MSAAIVRALRTLHDEMHCANVLCVETKPQCSRCISRGDCCKYSYSRRTGRGRNTGSAARVVKKRSLIEAPPARRNSIDTSETCSSSSSPSSGSWPQLYDTSPVLTPFESPLHHVHRSEHTLQDMHAPLAWSEQSYGLHRYNLEEPPLLPHNAFLPALEQTTAPEQHRTSSGSTISSAASSRCNSSSEGIATLWDSSTIQSPRLSKSAVHTASKERDFARRCPDMHCIDSAYSPPDTTYDQLCILTDFASVMESSFETFLRQRGQIQQGQRQGDASEPDHSELLFYYSSVALKRKLKWLRDRVRCATELN